MILGMVQPLEDQKETWFTSEPHPFTNMLKASKQKTEPSTMNIRSVVYSSGSKVVFDGISQVQIRQCWEREKNFNLLGVAILYFQPFLFIHSPVRKFISNQSHCFPRGLTSLLLTISNSSLVKIRNDSSVIQEQIWFTRQGVSL